MPSRALDDGAPRLHPTALSTPWDATRLDARRIVTTLQRHSPRTGARLSRMVFYRDILGAAIKIDPSAAVRAIVDEVLAFEMPGAGIPGFLRKAATIARAGI